jgi:hypothetical protein
MRVRKPSPAMVVALIALFVSLGGTSVAAVNFARNAGKVDGKDAVRAGASRSRAAGNLVATNKSGPDKGRIPGSHLADVPHTQTFGRAFDVVDNVPGAPTPIGAVSNIGSLTATCNDQANRAGVEDPTTELNFINSSGQVVNVARRVGVGQAFVEPQVSGTSAPLTISGSNTFSYSIELRGVNVVVNGVVRQDGRGTATASCLVWGTVLGIRP